MRALALLALLALPTSCSFVFTTGPDSGPPRAYPSCTSSMTSPIVDGVFSGIFLAAMIGAISEDDESSTSFDDDEASKAEKITSSALFAAATGIGAYVGYRRVSGCRRAREQFAAQYPQGMQPYGYGQPYPPPYGQPPAPYPGQYGQPPAPYPGQYGQPPAPAPPTPAQPTAQPAPAQPAPGTPAQPAPAPTPIAPAALGTEGDVCASTAECATGLTCTSNVCVRPPARR